MVVVRSWNSSSGVSSWRKRSQLSNTDSNNNNKIQKHRTPVGTNYWHHAYLLTSRETIHIINLPSKKICFLPMESHCDVLAFDILATAYQGRLHHVDIFMVAIFFLRFWTPLALRIADNTKYRHCRAIFTQFYIENITFRYSRCDRLIYSWVV